ncbi:MAG: hypothetical protein ACRDD8_06330 [Bacteroidales bacterium]
MKTKKRDTVQLKTLGLETIAELLQLPSSTIVELADNGYLDFVNIRKKLIANDWSKLKTTTNYTSGAITEALSKKYDLSKDMIQWIVYNKDKAAAITCSSCGVEITRYKHKKNGGMCDKCVTNQILNATK